jgi:hypothetical protein
MQEEIIQHIENPHQLEKLYRKNKTAFKKAFNTIYPQLQENSIAQTWNQRLNFKSEEITVASKNELLIIIIASLLAMLLAKIPEFTGIDEIFYYSRNVGFIIFPILTAYFAWRNNLHTRKLYVIIFSIIISAIYINSLPEPEKSDSLLLTSIHLPLLLWSILGFTFAGNEYNMYSRRLDYLRYNGELIIMTTIILIAGGILTGITLGLFALIDVEIYDFYFEYVVIWGLVAAPIIGTYLLQIVPQLVNKVSPVIAKVFTPLVLVTLIVYLITLIGTGQNPYKDRDFLLIFNFLLLGVMAIVLFSIAGTTNDEKGKASIFLLFSLSVVTIIINTIALTAILFRITEWGITPNRLAVLGGNALMLANLLMVAYHLLNTIRNKNDIENVEKSIAQFLPIYAGWTIVVTFIFPFIFQFK